MRREYQRSEEFGKGSDDTAHPSQWQVPAVPPLLRTKERRSAPQG